MVESTLENIGIMEKLGFYNFKVSAKASSVLDTISVYRTISKKTDYPLHLGVTEAGPMFRENKPLWAWVSFWLVGSGTL